MKSCSSGVEYYGMSLKERYDQLTETAERGRDALTHPLSFLLSPVENRVLSSPEAIDLFKLLCGAWNEIPILLPDEPRERAIILQRTRKHSAKLPWPIGFLFDSFLQRGFGKLNEEKTPSLWWLKALNWMRRGALAIHGRRLALETAPSQHFFDAIYQSDKFPLTRAIFHYDPEEAPLGSIVLERAWQGFIEAFVGPSLDEPVPRFVKILGGARKQGHKYFKYFEHLRETTVLEMADVAACAAFLFREEPDQMVLRQLPQYHALRFYDNEKERDLSANLAALAQRAKHYGFPSYQQTDRIDPRLPLKVQATHWAREVGLADPELRWYFLQDIAAAWHRIRGLLEEYGGSYKQVWVGMGIINDHTHSGVEEYEEILQGRRYDTGRLIRGITCFEDFVFMVLPTAVKLLKKQATGEINEPIWIKVFPQDETRGIEIGSFVLETFPAVVSAKMSSRLRSLFTSAFVRARQHYERNGNLKKLDPGILVRAHLFLYYIEVSKNKEVLLSLIDEDEFIRAMHQIGVYYRQLDRVVFTAKLPKGLTPREDKEEEYLTFSLLDGWQLVQQQGERITRNKLRPEEAKWFLTDMGILSPSGRGYIIEPRLVKLLNKIEEKAGKRIADIELMSKKGDFKPGRPRLAFVTDVILSGPRDEKKDSYVDFLNWLFNNLTREEIRIKAKKVRKDLESSTVETVGLETMQVDLIRHFRALR